MNIEFKEGAVCYAYCHQYYVGEYYHPLVSTSNHGCDFSHVAEAKDFKLNEPYEGWYIPKSELDTEEKYKKAVEVFGFFGFNPYLNNRITIREFIREASNVGEGLILDDDKDIVIDYDDIKDINQRKTKCTFDQLMAIGELKRKMLERESKTLDTSSFNTIEQSRARRKELNRDGNKYHREIIGLDGTKTTVDVYRVLDAFKTGCAATDHAIKKMLCAGLRGHKDKLTDYDNAIESLQEAKNLLIQKGE